MQKREKKTIKMYFVQSKVSGIRFSSSHKSGAMTKGNIYFTKTKNSHKV